MFTVTLVRNAPDWNVFWLVVVGGRPAAVLLAPMLFGSAVPPRTGVEPPFWSM